MLHCYWICIMKEAFDRLLAERVSRRHLLHVAAGAAAWVTVPGCNSYAPGSCGEAYDAWAFPDDERRPEFLAVAAAILAASPHNTQPWLFRIEAERIDIFADFAKSLGAMDGLQREMYIGLGCALENLLIAARHHGKTPAFTLLPDESDVSLVATVNLTPGEPTEQELYPALTERHTNRGRYVDDAPEGLEAALRALITEPEVELTFLAEAAQKDQFRTETIEATRAIVADREMNEAGHAWWRHSCDDIDKQRDGVTMDATGQGATTRFLGKGFAAPDAETAGKYWLNSTEGDQTTAAAFVILSTPDRNDRAQQLAAGQAFQRLHLWATTQGLAVQPLNQLAERQDREEALGLEPRFTRVLEELLGAERGAQMLFRIGYAWDEAFASPRRPVEWVIV
jgi:hypothetical protein